jgi:hypothetical protein
MGLMGSLAAILEDRRDDAAAIMRAADVHREPETLFYFARHFAMIGDQAETIRMVERARGEGFTVSHALAHDEAFGEVRSRREFQREIDESARIENETRHALARTGFPIRPNEYARP